jgi:hypothetical protein
VRSQEQLSSTVAGARIPHRSLGDGRIRTHAPLAVHSGQTQTAVDGVDGTSVGGAGDVKSGLSGPTTADPTWEVLGVVLGSGDGRMDRALTSGRPTKKKRTPSRADWWNQWGWDGAVVLDKVTMTGQRPWVRTRTRPSEKVVEVARAASDAGAHGFGLYHRPESSAASWMM